MLAPEDKLHTLTDKELWNCFQNNHMKAFSLLFSRHYSVLYNYGLKLSQDEYLTKDCIQESFADLWFKRTELPEVVAVKPYLLTIIRRRIYNAQLMKAKHMEQDWDYKNYEFNIEISHEDFLIQQHSAEANQTKLREAINKLSPRQKEVIYLRFFDGLSCEEIAKITTVKYQSVINLMHEAIKKLREHVLFSLPFFTVLVNYTLL